MNIETDNSTVNMNVIIERICTARDERHFDDVRFVAGIGDLWEACRSYLMRFQIDELEHQDPSGLIDWGRCMPANWNEHVRERLAFLGRKYGYVDVTAVVKGVEYKVSAIDNVLEERTKHE